MFNYYTFINAQKKTKNQNNNNKKHFKLKKIKKENKL